jgi:acyl carrier protein
MTEIKDKIRQFIIDNFLFGEAGDLEDNTSFLESGIIDSTGVLELIGFLEEEFSIQVDDEELIPENLDSINNLCVFLNKKKVLQQAR